MDVDQAVNVLARHVIDGAADSVGWESYPDLTQADWHAVCDKVEDLLRRHIRPSIEDVQAAYDLLSERAETS